MSRKSGVLGLAILGLLHGAPLHGYELRKRLNTVLGNFRALSYGSLYPALRELREAGLIAEESPDPSEAPPLVARRAKVVFKLTAEGKERFQTLLTEAGPAAWEDETFGVHFAFFAQTDAATRMRILEGRRTRLEERTHTVRSALARTREKLDSYTLELQRHGLESVEREVRWLNELISAERAEADTAGEPPAASSPDTPGAADGGAPSRSEH